jgi:hypothetical protein
LVSCAAWGQNRSKNGSKSTYTRERFNHNATRVRGSKAKIVCPIFQESKYPYHGLGVKLGDPFAITYKFYPNKNIAIAADLGRPASGLYNRYFREQFNSYVQDTVTAGASVIYLTHLVKSDYIAELKLLYHIDAGKISPGLQVYVGAGWEWKRSRIRYDYQYDASNVPDPNAETPFGNFIVSRLTQGPQAVIGFEYSYFQLPISAFMELEYFTDIQLDPGWRRVEGGVGLRYVF